MQNSRRESFWYHERPCCPAQCTVHIAQFTVHIAICTVDSSQFTVHGAQCSFPGSASRCQPATRCQSATRSWHTRILLLHPTVSPQNWSWSKFSQFFQSFLLAYCNSGLGWHILICRHPRLRLRLSARQVRGVFSTSFSPLAVPVAPVRASSAQESPLPYVRGSF